MARSTTTRSSTGSGRFFGSSEDDAGFSLMEAIVAFTIFVIVSVSASFGLVKIIQLTSVTSSRVTASQLATQELEKMRDQSNAGQQVDSYLVADGPAGVRKVTLAGMTYTVTPQLYPDPRHPGDPICASVPSSTPLPGATTSAPAAPSPTVVPTAPPTWERRVSVTVSWGSGSSGRSVRYDSVLAC